MDYEKKYKDALQRAKHALDCDRNNLVSTDTPLIYSMFPELKESDDDKIRKEILELVRQSSEVLDKQNQNNMIAWLEKQGQKETIWKEGDVVRHGSILALVTNGRRAIKSNLEQITIQYPNEWVKTDSKERKYFFEEIEKQGEQKPQGKTALEAWKDMRLEVYQQASGNRHEPNYSDDSTQMFSLNDIDEIIEKMSEQKSTDKVEPKFHKDEWIITKANNLYQVTAIIDDKYQLKYGDNFTVQKCADVDESARLWTIQDAKDGDVLQLGKVTAIFKEFIGDEHCECYCSIYEGVFEILSEDDGDNIYGCYNATPATKEQRDTLERAMTDAEYIFDFEKKELKKIGNKKPLLSDFFKAEYERGKADAQKLARWSEEDEKMLNDIDITFFEEDIPNVKYWKFMDWLKSLKQRIGG